MTRAYTENEVNLCRKIADIRGLPTYEVEWWYGPDGVPVPLLSLEDCIEEMEGRGYGADFISGQPNDTVFCNAYRKKSEYPYDVEATAPTNREAALMCLCEIVRGEK